MPKITDIFIDLDGTLLDDHKEIDPLAKQVIPQLLDQSIQIWLCSGRPVYFVEYLKNQIDSRIQTISYNGAMFNHTITESFDPSVLHELMAMCDETISLIFKSETTLYTNQPELNPWFQYRYLNIPEKQFSQLKDDPILKVVLVIPKERYQEIRDKVKKLPVEMTEYSYSGMELAPLHMSKGVAVSEIKNSNNYCVAIGDGTNDLEMMQVCDYKVAMANAHPRVLDIADEIILSNNHQGVGKYLETLLERGE